MEGYTQLELSLAAGAGIRAPSLHNSQPWRFVLDGGAIELRLDPERLLPASDPTLWAARLSAGAALLNMRLALATAQRPALVELSAPAEDPHFVARLSPAPIRPPSPADLELRDVIPHRTTNRRPLHDVAVPAELLWRLRSAAEVEGGWLRLIIGHAAVQTASQIARSANVVLLRNEVYRQEQAAWTQAGTTPDGVAMSPAPGSEDQGLPQRPYCVPTGSRGDRLIEPAILVLGTGSDHRHEQIRAGMALQRMLLTATQVGLAVSMFSQPIEVPAARDRLRVAVGQDGVPHMMFQVGYAQQATPTPRRPLTEFLQSAPSKQLVDVTGG